MNRWMLAAAAALVSTVTVGCAADYGVDGPRSLRDDDAETAPKLITPGDDDDGDDVVSPEAATAGSASPALADGPVRTITPRCNSTDQVNGNGEITRLSRNVADFIDVDLNLAGKLVIQEGSTFGVQVEVDSNLQDSIVAEKSGTEGRVLLLRGRGAFCSHDLKVLVTMPKFHGARVSGAGNADITKKTAASDVALEVTGAGNITFRGNATKLRILVSGAGNVLLDSGAAQSTVVTLSGVGDVGRKTFDAGKVTKQGDGVGDVTL